MTIFKVFLFWFGLVLLVIVVTGAVTLFVLDRNNQQAIAAELDKVREAGQPVTFEEVTFADLSDEENSAKILSDVAEDLQNFERKLHLLRESWNPEPYAPPLPLTSEQGKEVQQLLADFPELLSAITRAAEAKGYRPNFDTKQSGSKFTETMMADTMRYRSAARVLDLQRELHVLNHESEEAVNKSLQILKLAKQGRSGFLATIGYLISCSLTNVSLNGLADTMGHLEVTAEDQNRITDALVSFQDEEGFQRASLTERVFTLLMMEEMPMSRYPFYHPIKGQFVDILQSFEHVLNLKGNDYRSRTEILQAREAALDEGSLAASTFGAIIGTNEAEGRLLVKIRCLRLLMAYQEYLDTHGKAPESLSDLGLSDELITDPYSGEPLKVLEKPEGIIIYSIGSNQEDDQGDFESGNDVGIGPVSLTRS